jgi:hypothetical protein
MCFSQQVSPSLAWLLGDRNLFYSAWDKSAHRCSAWQPVKCRNVLSDTISERLAVFERKVLRKILGTIKINSCRRRRHNNELTQLYGDLDIVSFIRINRLRWIGHANRMDNKRMVYEVFANQPQGSRLTGRPKYRWWDCVYGDVRKCKIRNWEQR